MHNSYVPRVKNSETRHLPPRNTKQPRLPPQLSAKSKKSSPTRKANIHRLPNEILLDVFDIVIPESCAAGDWERDVFALRSTCRRFRLLSSHLKLWKSVSFSFADLELSRPSSPKTLSDYKYRGFRLLRRLKADPVIYEKLKNRDRWSVGSVQMAVELFRELPNIRTKIRHFTFERFDSCVTLATISPDKMEATVRDAMLWLAHCPNLKSLKILHRGCILDGPNDDLGLDGLTLGGLFNLQHITIADDEDVTSNFDIDLLWNVFNFALNLKSLDLSYPVNMSGFYRYMGFPNNGRFAHLTWLRISPFSDESYDALTLAHLPSLRAFLTTLSCQDGISPARLGRLLDLPSFSNLGILSVLIEPHCSNDSRSFNNRNFWNAITRSGFASKVEYLELSMGLVTAWLQDITRFSQLKALYWTVDIIECVLSDDPDVPFKYGQRWDSVTRLSGAMIEREAARYWKTTNTPAFNFCVLNSIDPGGLWSWSTSAFELEERGFDVSSVRLDKILKINSDEKYFGSQ